MITSERRASEYVRFRLGDERTAARRLAAFEDVVRAMRDRKSGEPGGQLTDHDAEEAALAVAAAVPREAAATFESPPDARAWLPSGGLVVKGWDLVSVLWSIFICEYDLGEIVPLDPGSAQVHYAAHAWPFGGLTSLVRLVEAFGFGLTEVHDGADILTPDWFADD
jgi:hypothetical protein